MPQTRKNWFEKQKLKAHFVSYEQFPNRTKRRFKCSICKVNLSTKETLRKHIHIKHIKLKPHVCRVCNQRFIFEKSRIIHEQSHNDVSLYECFCGKKFELKLAFHHHKKHSHPQSLHPALHQCSLCNLNCVDKKQLRYHLQTRHAPRTIYCTFPSCKRSFSTKALFNQHFRSHSREKYACPFCNKTFRLRSYMERHKISHTKVRPFECPDCDKKYRNASHLNTHRSRVHLQSDGYLCSICGKLISNKYDLTLHENAHKGGKPYECDLCDFKASFRASLYHHTKKHLSAPVNTAVALESKDAKAKISRSESQATKKNIPHYTQVSSETKPFKCVDCDNTFKSAVRANEHWRRYHLLRSEFKCRICKAIFQDEVCFEAHKKCHKDEEQFECRLCNFKTSFRIGLHAHSKIHSKCLESRSSIERVASVPSLHLEDQIGNTSFKYTTEQELKTGVETEPMGSSLLQKQIEKGGDHLLSQGDGVHLTGGCSSTNKSHVPQRTKYNKVRRGPQNSLHSPLNMTPENGLLWEAEWCYGLSTAGLFSDQSLDSVRELKSGNNDSSRLDWGTSEDAQITKTVSPTGRNLAFNINTRNPKITLNCTAAEDEEIKFHSSHFV